MERLIKTISCEKGELYNIVGDKRLLLARCEPKLEIYEHSQSIPILGKRSYDVKRLHAVLVLCGEPELTRAVDEEYLERITRFEFVADIQRSDGVFESMKFDNILPVEIWLDGDWTFEVACSSKLARRLLNI